MTEQELTQVTAASSTFAALRSQASAESGSGKTTPESGNSVPPAEPRSPDPEELARALNLASQSIGRDLRFQVDMESGQSVIQVLDRDTGEVIRQIPPEKAVLYASGSGAVQLQLYNRHV